MLKFLKNIFGEKSEKNPVEIFSGRTYVFPNQSEKEPSIAISDMLYEIPEYKVADWPYMINGVVEFLYDSKRNKWTVLLSDGTPMEINVDLMKNKKIIKSPGYKNLKKPCPEDLSGLFCVDYLNDMQSMKLWQQTIYPYINIANNENAEIYHVYMMYKIHANTLIYRENNKIYTGSIQFYSDYLLIYDGITNDTRIFFKKPKYTYLMSLLNAYSCNNLNRTAIIQKIVNDRLYLYRWDIHDFINSLLDDIDISNKMVSSIYEQACIENADNKDI